MHIARSWSSTRPHGLRIVGALSLIADVISIAMFDLAEDATSHQVIREFYECGTLVSAVCHGPIALANVKLSNGSFLVADQPVTGFSNVEEDQAQLSEVMPFLLETVLKEHGAKFEKADEPWGAHVTTGGGGKILTGQNPNSAGPLGKALLKAIVPHA